MLPEQKMKKLEQLLKGKWWEEVVDVIKKVRTNAVHEIIAAPKWSDLQYNHDDILKERIRILNWILQVPQRLLSEVKNTLPQGELVEDTGDDLSIGDVDDL